MCIKVCMLDGVTLRLYAGTCLLNVWFESNCEALCKCVFKSVLQVVVVVVMNIIIAIVITVMS